MFCFVFVCVLFCSFFVFNVVVFVFVTRTRTSSPLYIIGNDEFYFSSTLSYFVCSIRPHQINF